MVSNLFWVPLKHWDSDSATARSKCNKGNLGLHRGEFIQHTRKLEPSLLWVLQRPLFVAKSAGHVTQTTAPGAQAVWQRVDKNAPILSLRCVHVEPSQWDQIIPCDAFNLRFRKTKVSLRQWWICVILLPPFKAGSHTQRNTYESCKPHRIQWKNELWCYGNPKQQLLLPLLLQEWMWVNLIQSGRETGVQCWSMSKTSI